MRIMMMMVMMSLERSTSRSRSLAQALTHIQSFLVRQHNFNEVPHSTFENARPILGKIKNYLLSL